MSQTSAGTIIIFLERDIGGGDLCVSRIYQQLFEGYIFKAWNKYRLFSIAAFQ